MSRFVTSVRNFWRAFRQGPGTPRIRHHGHDLARTAKDAYTVSHLSLIHICGTIERGRVSLTYLTRLEAERRSDLGSAEAALDQLLR